MVIVIKKGESKKSIQNKLRKLKGGKGFPASKFTGKIKIDEDPVAIQRRLRDEWK
jgi:hypothetical protein